MIQSLQNPFRDWNISKFAIYWIAAMIQSLQNPFRDWNAPPAEQALQAALRIQSLQNPFRDWNLDAFGGG